MRYWLNFGSIVALTVLALSVSVYALPDYWNTTGNSVSTSSYGGYNLVLTTSGTIYTNTNVTFNISFWGGTPYYNTTVYFDGYPSWSALWDNSTKQYWYNRPTIGYHTVYVSGEDQNGNCLNPVYSGGIRYCDNTKFSQLIAFNVQPTDINVSSFTFYLDKNLGGFYDTFSFIVGNISGGLAPYTVKLEYYNPYENSRNNIYTCLVDSGGCSNSFNGNIFPTSTTDRTYGLIITVTDFLGSSRILGNFYTPFTLPLTITGFQKLPNLVGGYMNDTIPVNIPLDRVKLTYSPSDYLGYYPPYNITFFDCVASPCNTNNEIPLCTFVNKYDTTVSLTFYPNIGTHYWGYLVYDSYDCDINPLSCGQLFGNVNDNPDITIASSVSMNNQSQQKYYVKDCIEQGGYTGRRINAWGNLSDYNNSVADYISQLNNFTANLTNISGNWTQPTGYGTGNNGIPVKPADLPTHLTQISDIVGNPMVYWTIILIIGGMYVEQRTKTDGKAFLVILIVGITGLSLWGVYPKWVVILEIILAGAVIGMKGKQLIGK